MCMTGTASRQGRLLSSEVLGGSAALSWPAGVNFTGNCDHVGKNINLKYVPIFSCTLLLPFSKGKIVYAFWNVLDSEDYNVYNVWIWEMLHLGLKMGV